MRFLIEQPHHFGYNQSQQLINQAIVDDIISERYSEIKTSQMYISH